MKLTIDRDLLADALALAVRVAESKSATSIPIMGNVLLRADSKLLVAACAPSAAVSCELDAKIEAPGVVTLSAKGLLDIVKSLSGGPLSIKSEAEHPGVAAGAEIRQGKAVVKLAGLPANDFPKLPDHREQKFFPVDEGLRALISRSAYAACMESLRENLYGICVESVAGKSTTVKTTDGHQCWIGAQLATAAPMPRTLLPPRIAADLGHMENAEMALTPVHAFIRSGGKVIALSLTGGKFPDLETLLPKEMKMRPVVPRVALLKAAKRAALMSSESVRLSLSDGALTVSSVQGVGDAKEEITVSYSGNDFEWGCSPRYLVAALEAFDSDEAVIGLKDRLSPFSVRAMPDDGTAAFVLPMDLGK